ncbi:MAG: 2-phosphosulfolactate phosphatase [Bacteroidales bacterium]|nr:MAG: 2-phosphosulfolactate phosphatase [Bacteroidales bacterium]
MNTVEVCFSTELFKCYDPKGKIVVVVDVLRATSVICTMMHNGVKEIIPVKTIEEAKEYKEKGYMVVAERNGEKLDFADFGNSPFLFTKEVVDGKTIVYSTTNGTNAITVGNEADEVVIGAFLNFTALANYLEKQGKDVLILCSGWKGKFCIEDALLAGAISGNLIGSGFFYTKCDSVNASIDMWAIAKDSMDTYIEKIAQKHRLKKLGLDDVIEYCFTHNLTSIIPMFNGLHITPLV